MSAPLLQQTSPADNSSIVATTANFVLTFNQIIGLGTSGTIRIYESDGTLFHTISVTDASQVSLEGGRRPTTVTINPNINLDPGTGYYVLIDAGTVENGSGEDFAGISSPTAFNFTTAGAPPGGGDTTAPTLTSTTPLDNATGVSVGSNLVLTFSESVQAGSGNIEIRKVSDNSIVTTILVTDGTQVTFAGNQMTINPTTDLAANTGYYVTMASGVVRDLANNNFAGISSTTTFNFTTADVPVSIPGNPVLLGISPADNSVAVGPDTDFVFTFNEPVEAGIGFIAIRDAADRHVVSNIPVWDTAQVVFSGNQMTVNPASDLPEGMNYYITIPSGTILDLDGDPFYGLVSPTAFNFSTSPFNPNEVLLGTSGGDTLNGQGGDDVLNGLSGLDTLIGGDGDDTYIIRNYERGQTSILLYNESGNYVASFLPADDEMSFTYLDHTGDGKVDFLRVFYSSEDHFWSFDFSTNKIGQNLAVGTYLNARESSYFPAGHPGLYAGGDGFGAGQLYGQFTISNVVFNYSGGTTTLVSLSVSFEYHSSTETSPGFYGTVNYHYGPAGDATVDTIFENDGGGNDTVIASVNYTLVPNVENLTLTGSDDLIGRGNSLDNTITGNWGDNLLDGGAGADTFEGDSGEDIINIMAGSGSDTIVDFQGVFGDVVNLDGFELQTFAAVQAAMSQSGGNTVLNLGNGETLTFLNLAPSAFTQDDFTFLALLPPLPPPPSAPDPFTLPVSGAFTNTISGTRRADNLTGSIANDRLDGKQGNDTMTGLAGDDTYLVNAAGDNVVESASNDGIDTVISSASSYTLPNNVENLTLTGTTNHTVTGNGLDNLIIASVRPDIINSGAGNDIIRAGTGACVLTGGAGNDIFDFDVMGSQKQITDFAVGEDLIDLRTLLAWYGGSDPLASGAISLSAVAGGVLVSVKASAGGALQGLVKITGVSVGDLDIGSDVLWDS